ncbi:MAG: hypothetical protein JNM81_15615 [Rhodospirillaceae bacterium]|nr:hypothetical protein [Rhodospirillaceae bacterium]
MSAMTIQRSAKLTLLNPSRRYRIGFLFNHEAVHQVAHSAPIAAQLAMSDPLAAVEVIATSASLLDRARCFLSEDAQRKISFTLLLSPPWQTAAGRILDSALPFSRIANLVRHRNVLARFDALVVPERTSLLLKSLLGESAPLLIHTKHGSGDRAQGYARAVGRFDLVLLSGEKLRDRMTDAGVIKPQQCAIVGYPKFDTVDHVKPAPLFENGKPTVVYNPHPEPSLSSWYDMGLDVLNYFSNQADFNLIFAPHVMLFQRRMHVSLEAWRIKLRRDLPSKFFCCPHILIDTGSPKLSDMTYTRAADIYMGDVSSQIYEFLLRPRPMIFLNPLRRAWRGDRNYDCWNFGTVVEDINGLPKALQDAVSRPDCHRLAQERGFRYTFELNEKPSSLRAAQAITQCVRRTLHPVDLLGGTLFSSSLFSGQCHPVDAHGRGIHTVQEFQVRRGG